MAGPDAPELLALVMAHLDELGLAESLACLQRESGVPHVPGHFAPAELSRRLESSAAPAASTGIAAAAELTPELDLLTAGRGDYVSAELDQLSGCHTGNITCARWVRDGTVISGGADRQLCVTRLDGSPRSSMPLDAAALSLDVLDYGSGRYVVAVGCMDGSTSLFSVGTDGTMMLVRRAKHHLKYNHAVRWNTTGGKQLATASFDHQVHVYPATVAAPPDEAQPSGALEPAERLYFHGVVEDIAWAGGGTVLAAAVRNDHRLHLFSAGTGGGALERRLLHLNENPLDDFCSFTVLSLAPSPNGRWLAAHTDKGQILLLCLQTGKRVRTLHGTAGDEYSRPVQAWHPAGRYIYASANDTPGTIVVWELASERKVATLDGHKGLVRDLHPLLVAGQHLLLSCGYDKTIRVWAAASDSLAAGAAGALE